MKWQKKGHIYGPSGTPNWAQNSALTPTPILLNPDTIRVYAGFRDSQGVSRIGFVDLDSNNPGKVLRVSENPALDIGQPGAFDDNGVILGDVIKVGDSLHMYYVGFQLVAKAKFLAFSGLAVSTDGGDSFKRVSTAPVLDRANEGIYIRAIHSVHQENGLFRAWYACDDGWELIDGKPYPRYQIRHASSVDGIHFDPDTQPCIPLSGDEYRIGRPRVFFIAGQRYMHFTWGTPQGDYFPGLAKSDDGLNWTRIDDQLGIALAPEGWDSQHLCYPALMQVNGRTLMFYNGNNMGSEGFGWAELESAD